MYTVTLKSELPEAIINNTACTEEIKRYWRNQPVAPYGRIIQPYGTSAPYNRPHVAVALVHNGEYMAGFTVIALDESIENIDMSRVPAKPAYSGSSHTVYNLDNATCRFD